MTDIEVEEEDLSPVAHVIVVYRGPAAPHWELKVRYGDQTLVDDFWTRAKARLLLLPKHDPQFRRNRERVNRDAERERIICDWDLGDEEVTESGGAARQEAEQTSADVEGAEQTHEQAASDEAVVAEETAEEAVESADTDSDLDPGADVDADISVDSEGAVSANDSGDSEGVVVASVDPVEDADGDVDESTESDAVDATEELPA